MIHKWVQSIPINAELVFQKQNKGLFKGLINNHLATISNRTMDVLAIYQHLLTINGQIFNGITWPDNVRFCLENWLVSGFVPIKTFSWMKEPFVGSNLDWIIKRWIEAERLIDLVEMGIMIKATFYNNEMVVDDTCYIVGPYPPKQPGMVKEMVEMGLGKRGKIVLKSGQLV